jgi:hypothetical protein
VHGGFEHFDLRRELQVPAGRDLCKGYADRVCEHQQHHALYEGLVLFVLVGMLPFRHLAICKDSHELDRGDRLRGPAVTATLPAVMNSRGLMHPSRTDALS